MYREGLIRLLKRLPNDRLLTFHIFWIGTDIIQREYKFKFIGSAKYDHIQSHTCFNTIDICYIKDESKVETEESKVETEESKVETEESKVETEESNVEREKVKIAQINAKIDEYYDKCMAHIA
jgi:hypothetical protein